MSCSSVSQASGFIGVLNDENFIFWLTFFYKIMPHVDILFSHLQRRDCTPSLVQIKHKAFELEILKIRSTINITPADEEALNKRKLEEKRARKREAVEVCDVIITEIQDRFSFVAHLRAALLLLPDKFPEYEREFPDEFLKATLEVYTFIEEKKLRTELSIIYSTQEFRNIFGALPLMEFIRDNNISSTFSECVKLLCVILTIPMSTCEAERCFSSLKRIKTFLRNTMAEERLSALAMLSIERDFITQIKNFNERVMTKFITSKERRADFFYK